MRSFITCTLAKYKYSQNEEITENEIDRACNIYG
jgi:hypothetical protein